MSIIITTKERGKDKATTWVSEEYLLKVLEGLTEEYLRTKARFRYKETLPKNTLLNGVLPDTGAYWRYSKFHGKIYYDCDRIPDDPRTMYRSQLGPISELKNKKIEKGYEWLKGNVKNVIDKAVKEGYTDYLHYYLDYNQERREQLSKACAVVSALTHIVTEHSIAEKENKFWMMAAEVIEEMGVGYVPYNFRRLKEKVLPSLKGEKAVADIIDLPRANNQNARRIDDKEIEAWVLQLRGMGQNYPNVWITRKVQNMCLMTNKVVPSEGWFNAIFARPETKFFTAPGRYGKTGRRAQMYQGYIPMENAIFAGDCWHVDATRVNMIPYIKKVNVDGKDVYREEFMYQIIIRDVYSGDIMGRHMDTKESATGYIMAVFNSAKWQGYMPYEIVFDRFPGHNTEEWKLVMERLRAVGVKVTMTHKANGKAKLERWFGTLQSVFMTDSKYFYGEGIISNRAYAHRSSEYLYNLKKSARAAGWNFDEAWNEINNVIDRYRRTKYSEYSRKYKLVESSPCELHDESEKPNVIRMRDEELALIFGISKEISIRNAGLIRTEINRVEYMYEVNDHKVLSKYNKVLLAYDFEDLNRVFLFEISKDLMPKFLCEATTATTAQIYGPNADFSAMARAKERIAGIEEFRNAAIGEAKETASEMDMLLGAKGDKNKANEFEESWTVQYAPLPPAPTPKADNGDEDDDNIDINNLFLGQM
jgi:hypothetical protein